jgi:CBS domain-containing protein
MLDHKIGALAMLDGGRLVGIVTETDIMRAYADRREGAAALR